MSRVRQIIEKFADNVKSYAKAAYRYVTNQKNIDHYNKCVNKIADNAEPTSRLFSEMEPIAWVIGIVIAILKFFF